MKPDILIWWTSQRDCEKITGNSPSPVGRRKWPAYLGDQYSSRYGRNGRGRLWVADRFGEVSIEPWPNTPLSRALEYSFSEGSYAGIVVDIEDRDLVLSLPGIVTDAQLERVSLQQPD